MSPGLPLHQPTVIDARGLRCPWPVLRLARALRDGVGRDGVGRDGVGRDGVGRDGVGRDGAATVDLLTDDPAAAGEIAAFAAERGLAVAPIAGGWRVTERYPSVSCSIATVRPHARSAASRL